MFKKFQAITKIFRKGFNKARRFVSIYFPRLVKPQKPIYIGLFLDSKSKQKLLEKFPPAHTRVYAEHSTIVFKPDDVMFKELFPLMGSRFEFLVGGNIKDDKGQATVVVSSPFQKFFANRVPHITISVSEGTAPKYSNELLNAFNVEDIMYGEHDVFMLSGRLDGFYGT